ncbi:hypothetical protein ACFX15_031550 [Malus domestica]
MIAQQSIKCQVQKAYLQHNYPSSSVALIRVLRHLQGQRRMLALLSHLTMGCSAKGFDNRVVPIVITFMETKQTATFSVTCTQTGDRTWDARNLLRCLRG